MYAYDGILYIRGLIAGDRIDVFTPSGQLVFTTIADDYEFTKQLTLQSGFIVKINEKAQKIVTL